MSGENSGEKCEKKSEEKKMNSLSEDEVAGVRNRLRFNELQSINQIKDDLSILSRASVADIKNIIAPDDDDLVTERFQLACRRQFERNLNINRTT